MFGTTRQENVYIYRSRDISFKVQTIIIVFKNIEKVMVASEQKKRASQGNPHLLRNLTHFKLVSTIIYINLCSYPLIIQRLFSPQVLMLICVCEFRSLRPVSYFAE